MSALRKKIQALFIISFLLFFTPLEAKKKEYIPDIFKFVDLPPCPHGEMAFINGVNHKPDRAVRCSFLIADLSGGYNVYTIYNPTCGLYGDLKKCFYELFHFKVSPPIHKLHDKWDDFFVDATADEKYLQFCHSQGAIQVRNALLQYPEERRKRIVVVAIAPAAYITEDICHKCYHYVSRRDIVPLFDRVGKKKAAKSICMLTPHRKAAIFDHRFLSPTYRPAIQHHLMAYLNSKGKKFE